jgi:hypothetical protein
MSYTQGVVHNRGLVFGFDFDSDHGCIIQVIGYL